MLLFKYTEVCILNDHMWRTLQRAAHKQRRMTLLKYLKGGHHKVVSSLIEFIASLFTVK